MNILFLCREYDRKVGYGGIGTYVDVVSKHLVKLGHKVFIICSIPRKVEEIVEENNLVVYYAKQVQIKGLARLFKIFGLDSVYSRLMCALTNYIAYKKLFKKYKIDIVETPEWYNEGLFFSIFRPIPLVCRLQTPLFIINKYKRMGFLEYKISNFLEKFVVKHCDVIISPTKSLVDNIKSEFKIKHFVEIPYPIEVEESFKSKNLLETETILFVGRIEERKNPIVIVKAASYVIKNFPKVKFIFVGKKETEYKKRIDEIIEKFSLQEYIVFYDPLEKEKLKKLYEDASIIVVPSLSESFGYTLIEALSYGKAVICSKIPVFEELVSKNSVLFADPYNEQEWANFIVRLLLDKNLREELAKNAKCEVQKKYSVDVVIKKQIDCYLKAVEKYYDKKIIKRISGFYFALPNKYKGYQIPFRWRKYLIEWSKNYVVWPHFYMVTARQILDCIDFDLSDKKILDLGSTPLVSVLFAMLGAKVTMVDIDENEIMKAKNFVEYFDVKDKIDIVKEDLFKVKYENEFDIVYNCGVIEHFRNPVEIIKIMKKAAKQNGLVICLVPYFLTLHTLFIRKYIRKKRGYSWDWMGKEKSYSLSQLKKEFLLAGLKIKCSSVGNLARNICDDYLVNFFVNRFYFLGKFGRKLIYKFLNICDFFEKYTLLKKFGFVCVVCGTKNE